MNRVSVIVPTHNDAQLLRPGLVSLLSQSLPPSQVLVVNDGSTLEVARDALVDLEREFSDVNFIHQDNTGSSAARNRGIAEAKAPLLAFLDADDAFRFDCLERRLAHFHSSHELSGAYGGWESHVEGQSVAYSRFGNSSAAILDRDGVGRRIPGGLPLWVVRTEVVRRVGGFDPKLFIMEDFDLLLRLGRFGGLYAGDNEPTYLRALRPASTSRSSNLRTYAGTMRFLRKARREQYFTKLELARRLSLAHARAIRLALPRRLSRLFGGLGVLGAGRSPLGREVFRGVGTVTLEPEEQRELD